MGMTRRTERSGGARVGGRRRGRACQDQLTFDRHRHGGTRPGAGRPRGRGAGVAHREREALGRGDVVLVTLKLVEGVGSLRRRAPFAVVWAALVDSSRRDGFRVVEASVQGNHVHLLCEGDSREQFSRGMRSLTTRLAMRLNRTLGRTGRLFADRYHESVKRTPRAVWNALQYLFGNARRHGLSLGHGFVDPCSSAPWWRCWWNAPTNSRNDEPNPLAPARTWLLRRGHLRWGPQQVW